MQIASEAGIFVHMRRSGRSAAGVLAFIVGGVLTAPSLAQQLEPKLTTDDVVAGVTTPTSENAERIWYPVSKLEVKYLKDDVSDPPQDELQNIVVTLGRTPQGWSAPFSDLEHVPVRLGDIGAAGLESIDYDGLRAIGIAIVDRLKESGLLGLAAFPDPAQIQGRDDLRAGVAEANNEPVSNVITIFVLTGTVKEVRSIAANADDPATTAADRVNPDSRLHRRIRDNSPLQPGGVLRSQELDDYVARLNRHPGRRVDVAIGATDQPGEVALDYFVNEGKPWRLYAQLSNTGTESTGEWRQRFGFIHNNLTGNDDILQLDYSTASFDRANALSASYDVRFTDRLRGKIYGGWNMFEAPDLGIANQTQDFQGDGWNAGAELAWNFFQRGELFIDAVAGARVDHTFVESLDDQGNTLNSGEGSFLLPYGGVRLERVTEASSVFGSAIVETVASSFDIDSLNALGRTGVDDQWTVLKYEFTVAAYLEPLLSPGAWAGTADDAGQTLAHEVVASVRGQWGMGNRLIPTAQNTIGGLLTVRGYPESFGVGDSTVVATGEYRFHIPRAMGRATDRNTRVFGEPFRWEPWEPWGKTDWDLILRGFVDAGYTFNNDRIDGVEFDQTMVGAGVGLEFQFRGNVSVRADWGFALQEAENGNPDDTVDPGDSRLHFLATVSF